MTTPVLEVENVSIGIQRDTGLHGLVHGASFSIRPGEVAALVGESGSGKTLLAKAIVGLLPPGGAVVGGEIRLNGERLDERAIRLARGRRIAFIFQEPLSSLNPAMRIEAQMTEGLRGVATAERRRQALDMLRKVQIRNPEVVLRAYPHELSGGMRQRVMIAAALICEPDLIIADEPTTALDMVVQEEILGLLKQICADANVAVLLITHDLSVVAEMAHTIHVIEKGRIVESGEAQAVIGDPRHPYTQGLLKAIPQAAAARPALPDGEALIELRALTVDVHDGPFARKSAARRILSEVSLAVRPGETLAIIGESGSGKTTLARAMAGLSPATSGEILFRGRPLGEDAKAYHRCRQFIFQDPFGSLNPSMRVGDIVGEGLIFDRSVSPEERERRSKDALASVDLDPAFIDRYPHQLSGGQRQRVSIARAIVLRPELIIADEPVSALDLTVQRTVLDLFLRLKAEMGFACVIVSHDLGVIEHMADRVGVLYCGVLVEIGPRDEIFERPRHPYTRTLLASTSYLKASPDGRHSLARRTPPPALPDLFEPDAAGYQHPPFHHVEVGPDHLVARRA